LDELNTARIILDNVAMLGNLSDSPNFSFQKEERINGHKSS
jgi:hypothetical protein